MKSLRQFLGLMGLGSMVVIVATHYAAMPGVIPTHFNAVGVADGWGGKSMIWILVAVGCVVYAGLTLASFFPGMINVPVSAERKAAALPTVIEMVGWLKVITSWIFAWICWMTVQVGLGESTGLGGWFLPVTLIAIFGTIGFYLWRIMRVKI